MPAGVVRLRPSNAVGALTVSGLQVAGKPLTVSIDASGLVTSTTVGQGLTIEVAAAGSADGPHPPTAAAAPRTSAVI